MYLNTLHNPVMNTLYITTKHQIFLVSERKRGTNNPQAAQRMLAMASSRLGFNWVWLLILLVVRRTRKMFFPCPRLRLRLKSRETVSAVPSRVSSLILRTQAKYGAYSRAPLPLACNCMMMMRSSSCTINMNNMQERNAIRLL